MAIRFDSDFNNKIRREVMNYNQNRSRAIKRGLKNVPPIARVSDLKARYTSRKELEKELTRLRQFKAGKLTEVETAGGAKALDWELNYLRKITNEAKQYYNREILSTQRYLAKFPNQRDIGKEEHLNELLDKRSFLDQDIKSLNQEDYKTFRATVYDYTQEHYRSNRSYRGFLSEVEAVMTMVGIDKDVINLFMKKFKVLSPEEFVYLYNNSDLIARIYELADSPTLGKLKLNTSKSDAKEKIETLLAEQDDLIQQAQDEFKSLNALTNRQG